MEVGERREQGREIPLPGFRQKRHRPSRVFTAASASGDPGTPLFFAFFVVTGQGRVWYMSASGHAVFVYVSCSDHETSRGRTASLSTPLAPVTTHLPLQRICPVSHPFTADAGCCLSLSFVG